MDAPARDHRPGRVVRIVALGAMAALIVLGTFWYGYGRVAGTRAGTALKRLYGTTMGIRTFPPGRAFGIIVLPLHNVTPRELVIDRVEIEGPGVGTVVRVVKMQAAPSVGGVHGFPGGIWLTDPPVYEWGGVCHSPLLEPLHGFRIAPGTWARVWVVFEALAPGRWEVPNHTVYYSQGGVRYRQVLPVAYQGRVKAGSSGAGLMAQERACLDMTSPL